jgi:hypothetical protein
METANVVSTNNKTATKTTTKNSPLLAYMRDITASDKGLLQKVVKHKRPQSKNYEDSWGYVIQASRYGGFRWYDPQNKSLIFFGRKNDSDTRLVVPSFFASPKYLAKVIEILQINLKCSHTIIKNVNSEDVEDFLPYGFRPYTANECWDSLIQFDDQTFPQQIIKLESLINHKGGRYKNLRTALHKNPDLAIRKYISDDKERVLNLFALKDGNASDSKNKTKGMYYTSHALYATADIDKYVIFDKITGKIVGFTATSDISSNVTAYVASIFKPGIKVASVWGIYHTLLLKYQEKYKYVNLGGCETEGTYDFMRRTFQPFKKIAKTHLVYDPHK